jgi:tetratricopeptide (TPR) repeat protein
MQFASLASEQAQLAQARGDVSAALSGADRAIALAEGSRQQPQFLRRLLLRRSELNLQVHRLDWAAADARRSLGLELEAAAPGIFSSNLGLAYLALGRVLAAQGKFSEARSAFTSALENLQPTLGTDHPETRDARNLLASTHS